MTKSTGLRAATIAFATGAMFTTATFSTGATAQQNKDLSDKSVKLLMDYAWAITPPKFTTPTGSEIIVDKAKREPVMVPMDVAREVIRVGRLSASAQTCGLAEEQIANYQTLMKREQDKKKWTEQQLLYINQLHLFTVMMMTGGVKVVEKEGDKPGDKEVVIENQKLDRPKADACNDAEKKKVVEALKSYATSPVAAPAAAAEAPKKP